MAWTHAQLPIDPVPQQMMRCRVVALPRESCDDDMQRLVNQAIDDQRYFLVTDFSLFEPTRDPQHYWLILRGIEGESHTREDSDE
jgi:hypothetical protein